MQLPLPEACLRASDRLLSFVDDPDSGYIFADDTMMTTSFDLQIAWITTY